MPENNVSWKAAPDAVDPELVPRRILPTGATMPAIGLGTFGSDHVSPQEVAEAVQGAAEVGYRHFDCASVYGNEDQIGLAFEKLLHSGLRRKDLWITSKVWNDRHQNVIAACEKSLADLRLDYLDLYLVHWPFPNHHPPGCDVSARNPNAVPYIHENYMRTWRQMEELVDRDLVRHIGSSNMTIPKMKLLLRDARIKPVVNEMELHPHFQQPEFFHYLCDNGIAPIGFSPRARPHPGRHRSHRRSGHRQDCRASGRASRRCLHQVGRAARANADSLFHPSPQLPGQPARRNLRSADSRRDAGYRED